MVNTIQPININTLWKFACMGDLKALASYFRNGGEIGLKYERFNHRHSLIMGAIRNREFKTARFLFSSGESVNNGELAEIRTYNDGFGILLNNDKDAVKKQYSNMGNVLTQDVIKKVVKSHKIYRDSGNYYKMLLVEYLVYLAGLHSLLDNLKAERYNELLGE